MVPIVIGSLDSVTKRLKSFLKILDLNTLNVYLLQKTALLGTATTSTLRVWVAPQVRTELFPPVHVL